MSNVISRERAKRVKLSERKIRKAKSVMHWVCMAWLAWAIALAGTVLGSVYGDPQVWTALFIVIPSGAGLGWWQYEAQSQLWNVKDSHEDAVESWLEALQDELEA
jgi:hypothetical protein